MQVPARGQSDQHNSIFTNQKNVGMRNMGEKMFVSLTESEYSDLLTSLEFSRMAIENTVYDDYNFRLQRKEDIARLIRKIKGMMQSH